MAQFYKTFTVFLAFFVIFFTTERADNGYPAEIRYPVGRISVRTKAGYPLSRTRINPFVQKAHVYLKPSSHFSLRHCRSPSRFIETRRLKTLHHFFKHDTKPSRKILKVFHFIVQFQTSKPKKFFSFSVSKLVKIAKVFHNVVQKPNHRLLEEKFISLLQSCRTLKQLFQIQTQVITNGFEHNDFVTPKIVTSCAEIKRMDYARKVFDRIPEPDVALWNAMLRGYAKRECYRDVVLLFFAMKSLDVIPNCFTYPVVIKSCGKINGLIEAKEVHCVLIKDGFRANWYASTTLIEMYSEIGVVEYAYKVFGEMPERNVVAWTSMINGYMACGNLVSARRLFDLAPERDVVLWNSVVSGYIKAGDMESARALFDAMPNRDAMSWNTMLSGYAKNGLIEACSKLFEEAPERNIFSWNALIGGYLTNGRFNDALESFKRLLRESKVTPNDVTLVNVLSACARLGALDLGTWAHVYSESLGYKGNLFIGNALIDMYAKCGVIENSVKVFEGMNTRDVITWNSMVCGLAMHGRGSEALHLFHRMMDSGEKPDHITFIGILSACAHLGLVNDGLSFYQSMVDEYKIMPRIEHYGCVVDLFARAGLFDKAMSFVENMPMEADTIIWTALLGACKIYKNVEVAELALTRLIELEPRNPSNYVMLSNIYGDLGRWNDLARLKVAMRDTGFKKLPACSLIEVNDRVVEFYSLDERRPETEEISRLLVGITELLRSFGYSPDIEELELEV